MTAFPTVKWLKPWRSSGSELESPSYRLAAVFHQHVAVLDVLAALTWTERWSPPREARMMFFIFIASSTHNSRPTVTALPAWTAMEASTPGMSGQCSFRRPRRQLSEALAVRAQRQPAAGRRGVNDQLPGRRPVLRRDLELLHPRSWQGPGEPAGRQPRPRRCDHRWSP